MGFLRRLFGKDEGSAPDREGHRDEDHDGDEAASEASQRTYLEFIGGKSAKFYAVVLSADADGGWSVAFNFGRIGTPRDWGYKVEETDLDTATGVYDDLIEEKERKGYETRPWPASLAMPGGGAGERTSGAGTRASGAVGIFFAAEAGVLPAEIGGRVAGIALPSGRLFSAEEAGGPRGSGPLLWISEHPVNDVSRTWSLLANAFAETGLWPLVIDAEDGVERFEEILFDIPRGRRADAGTILRRWWADTLGMEEDEFDDFDAETHAPFGRTFPGLSPATPGDRPASIDRLVAGMTGHLGLVAVTRPADVLDAIAWSGAANYDANPQDQSTILRTWEDRFDAYLVGLGFDTLAVIVARPPADRIGAERIAAEHFAFCPDNITQGVGTLREYANDLVKAPRWDFWWD